MAIILVRNWPTLALRGLLAIAFGLLLLVWPAVSLAALVVLFGVFAMLDGGLALVAGLQTPARVSGRGMLLLGGVLGLAVGCLALGWPRLTALALLYLIAFRAIVIGLAEVLTAAWLLRDLADAWLLALVGLLSIAFGTVLVLAPATGLLALIWVIGAYALVIGVALLATAALVRGRVSSVLTT
jgi:uncharacterized membrane protein HdeD (DUF308 family)